MCSRSSGAARSGRAASRSASPGRTRRPEDKSRYVATAPLARGALVEDDEDGPVPERGTRRSGRRNVPSQASPVAMEQSCMSWQRSGTTRLKSGSRPAARSRSKRYKRNDPAQPIGTRGDVREVEKWVVLLRVAPRPGTREPPLGAAPPRTSSSSCRHARTVSARLGALTWQLVQSLVIPCVEPETRAR